jgi:hypothetical protein
MNSKYMGSKNMNSNEWVMDLRLSASGLLGMPSGLDFEGPAGCSIIGLLEDRRRRGAFRDGRAPLGFSAEDVT